MFDNCKQANTGKHRKGEKENRNEGDKTGAVCQVYLAVNTVTQKI
jgi:hypothetical protein